LLRDVARPSYSLIGQAAFGNFWQHGGSYSYTEPIEGGSPVIAEPAQFGGTRHLSAAQFVHDQRDAIALVASQDGRFTVFTWSPIDATVYANRIDTLLL
jgi:hypothetical protein